MNPVRSILYNGKTVSIRAIEDSEKFIQSRIRIFGKKDICPLCRQHIDSGDITLIVSNQANIPNRIAHNACFADKTDEYAFRLIAEDYQRFQQFEKDYEGWMEMH
jgi:hypothetical protein